MSSFFSFLKPDPHIEEIQDQTIVREKYNYWRVRVLYSTFVGYALYYFTRKSFTFAMPGLIQDLGYDKIQLGLLASILSISYGISKFANGILSDRSNPRYFMAIGLLFTGILNIFFGMSSSLFFFAIFWGLNGWFQGFGWPPVARFLTHWYSHNERGSWWATWNVSHNVGAFIIPWIAGFCLQYFGWRYAMYIPGIICIFGAIFLVNRLRDTPQSLGLPPIEKHRNDYLDESEKGDQEKELTTKEILVEYILKNKYIWILAISYFFVYIVRTGVNDWTALFLQETKNYNPLGANGCVSFFEVGGFFGSLFAGFSSDRIFGGRRGPVNVLFALAMIASWILFFFIPPGHYALDSIAMFFVGFAIFGPQMLIGVAAAELSHKKAAATSTGFVGCFAYMGAAFAGYPFGIICQTFGWYGFFVAMLICSCAAFLLLIPLWNVTSKGKVVPEKVKDVAPEAEYA